MHTLYITIKDKDSERLLDLQKFTKLVNDGAGF